jgi:hypothetical protein
LTHYNYFVHTQLIPINLTTFASPFKRTKTFPIPLISTNYLYFYISIKSNKTSKPVYGNPLQLPPLIPRSNLTSKPPNAQADLLHFIKREASRILQIISPVDLRVSREQFEQLDFIFAGGITFKAKSTILSLSTPFWQSSVNPTLQELAEWIKINLSINSHCYPTMSAQGSPLRDRSTNITNQELNSKYMYETLVQLMR